MKDEKKLYILIIVILFISVGLFYFYKKSTQINQDVIQKTNDVVNSISFSCDGGKSIKALVFNNKVELSLSDNRNLLLIQGVSASGVRYANSDESIIFWNKGDTAFLEENNIETFRACVITPVVQYKNTVPVQMANPASINCLSVGGNLKIAKMGDGGEYGLCYFEDNRACEEWSLMSGDCPVGGVKTTGFDTIDQNYCAWSGGKTLAVPNSSCIFKNGSKCSTIDFYNGKCTSQDVSPVSCTMEAKQCPDGSYIGRTGPNCEFVCPKI